MNPIFLLSVTTNIIALIISLIVGIVIINGRVLQACHQGAKCFLIVMLISMSMISIGNLVNPDGELGRQCQNRTLTIGDENLWNGVCHVVVKTRMDQSGNVQASIQIIALRLVNCFLITMILNDCIVAKRFWRQYGKRLTIFLVLLVYLVIFFLVLFLHHSDLVIAAISLINCVVNFLISVKQPRNVVRTNTTQKLILLSEITETVKSMLFFSMSHTGFRVVQILTEGNISEGVDAVELMSLAIFLFWLEHNCTPNSTISDPNGRAIIEKRQRTRVTKSEPNVTKTSRKKTRLFSSSHL